MAPRTNEWGLCGRAKEKSEEMKPHITPQRAREAEESVATESVRVGAPEIASPPHSQTPSYTPGGSMEHGVSEGMASSRVSLGGEEV